MNRRGFLSLLAPAAALIVAPELLIPRRTFFLPPAGGWGDRMTATEVLARQRAMLDQVYWIVFPAVMADLAIYGSSVTKFDVEAGRIHRVPLPEFTPQRVTQRAGLPSKYFKSL